MTSAAAGSPENGRRKNAKVKVDPKRNPERRGKYEKSTFKRNIGPEIQEKTELYLNSTSPDSRRKSLARRKPAGTRRVAGKRASTPLEFFGRRWRSSPESEEGMRGTDEVGEEGREGG